MLTLIGNRPEWVLAMVACFRQGYVVLPCTEQLRAKDLRLRLEVAAPPSSSATSATAGPAEAGLGRPGRVGALGRAGRRRPRPPPAELGPEDPCLVTFTSGTAGEPKAVAARPALPRRPAPAGRALARRPPGRPRLVHGGQRLEQVGAQRLRRALAARRAPPCCTTRASTPTSGSTSSSASAPRALHGADGVPGDLQARASRGPSTACAALVAAGEALNPEVLRAWHEATGLWIRDGYGQTETGQLTGMPRDDVARPGSMGRPLPGVRLWVDDGELCADPLTIPTFFRGYLGEELFPTAASRRSGAPAIRWW